MSFGEGWLRCKISPGMLSDEFAVTCNSADNNIFSFFTSEDLISKEKNSVKVNILDCQEDICLIFLPSMPFETSNRVVKVNRENLELK